MTKFSLCSYNIHNCYTDEGHPSFDQVVDTLKELQPDILCLQECSSHHVRKLQAALGYQHRLTYLGNTLMANFDIEEVSSSKSRPKYVTAKITVDPSQEPLFVTNLHLHHRAEPTRLREMDQIEKQLQNLFENNSWQIWAGDFNSLTREDYDEDYWEDVARVRRENFWEPPRTAVTSQMKKMGFEDCWALVGRPGAVGTCRFHTHIDYVYINGAAGKHWQCENVVHVESKASDHKPVIAYFSSNDEA